MAVISLITGAPGTGKSYYVSSRIKATLEALPSVRVRTNLPLNLDAWGALKDRIQPLGAADWKNDGAGGPWQLDDWRDVLLVLDECHNFICEPRMKPWHDWLGECRHRGVYGVWLITQSSKKVPQLGDVGLWVELQRPEEFRGKLTGIPLGVFWQWLSYLRGKRYSLACAYEYLDERKRKKPNKVQWLPIRPDVYRLYNSYSTPEKGGLSGACSEAWQLGFKPLMLYTLSESWFGLALRAALCVLVVIGVQAVFALPGALLANVGKPKKENAPPTAPALAAEPPQQPEPVQHAASEPKCDKQPAASGPNAPDEPQRKQEQERLKAWLQGADDVKAEVVPLPETPAKQESARHSSPAVEFEFLHSSR